MARPLRLEFASALYHLIARGNQQERIFLDDHDRQSFFDLPGKEVNQKGFFKSAGLVIIMIGATVITLMSGDIVMTLIPLVVGLLFAFLAYGRWWLPP